LVLKMRDTAAVIEIRGIDDALPSDVWTEGTGRFGSYQRFPAYTWQWFRRRAMVWWPLAFAHGIFVGMWHAASMATWADFFPLGSRAVLASLLTVSIGPLLAMVVRYRRLPYVAETILVVIAIIAGVFISHVLQELVADYHDMLMAQLGSGGSMRTPQAIETVSQAIAALMGQLPHWILLFLIGGGWELKSYFGERKLLTEYRRRRDVLELRRDKAEADLRLAVLQAQIEPHFLFNTLASIRSLVRPDPDRAEATISALSSYLRTTLPKLRRDVGSPSATLGEQIDICASYLELMQIRIGDRLHVSIDVSGALRAIEFPPLLLIPLVENAVKHGVEPKAGPVTIAIQARLIGDADNQLLQLDVEDDGMGMSESVGTGVGVANVRSQLERRFDGVATLEIDNRETGGVRSRITMPVRAL
jgi:hypothetical protein